MIAFLLSLLLTLNGVCGVQVEGLSPTGPPCGKPWTLAELRRDSGCSVVFHDGRQIVFISGWLVDDSRLQDPGRALFALGDGTPHNGACLCPLWERYPEYVIWAEGNPCPGNISSVTPP